MANVGYTLDRARLTSELTGLILEFVIENNASPTGIWRDFQCVHRSWRNLKLFIQAGLLRDGDLPTEPDATDYPDVTSAATLECPESCCKDCRRPRGCLCAACSGSSAENPSETNQTSVWAGFSSTGWDLLTSDTWSAFD